MMGKITSQEINGQQMLRRVNHVCIGYLKNDKLSSNDAKDSMARNKWPSHIKTHTPGVNRLLEERRVSSNDGSDITSKDVKTTIIKGSKKINKKLHELFLSNWTIFNLHGWHI